MVYNRFKSLLKSARRGNMQNSYPFFGKDTTDEQLDRMLYPQKDYVSRKRNNPLSPNDLDFKLTDPESDQGDVSQGSKNLPQGEHAGQGYDTVPEHEIPRKGWYKNNPIKLEDKDLLNNQFPSTGSEHMMDTKRNHGTGNVYGLPEQDRASALSSENETIRRSGPAYFRDRKPNSRPNGPSSIYKRKAASRLYEMNPLENLYQIQNKKG